MERAVVITVIMEIHADFLVLFQTPDVTLTRQNQRVLSIQPKITEIFGWCIKWNGPFRFGPTSIQ